MDITINIFSKLPNILSKQYKYKLFKKACHLSYLTKVGCCLLTESTEAI